MGWKYWGRDLAEGIREKQVAESDGYMCSDQKRRQEGSQVDSICFPLWKLIS